jgi:hypothetical protein
VVKGNRSPVGGNVTVTALHAKIALMPVIRRMTGITQGRGAIKYSINMAALTKQRGMPASQWENKRIVVKGSRLPTCGSVTVTTQRTKVTFMEIFCQMAGIAINRRILKNSIDMTVLTVQHGVFPGQFESKGIVVKGHRSPICGGMTIAAQRAKIANMPVVHCVACIATRRRGRKGCIEMAALTGQRAVRASQLEGG